MDLRLRERGPSSLHTCHAMESVRYGGADWRLNGCTGLAWNSWNSAIGSGLSVLGINSSSSASSSSDASSRYAARLGMRRFGFGEMISSGGTTMAGGDSGAPRFRGRQGGGGGGGARVMRGPWTSSVESIDSMSEYWKSSPESLDACY